MGKQKRSAETKKQIAESAARLFAEKGFSEVTMQEIADEARIGKGTLYYHVRGKEELALLVLETAASQLLPKAQVAAGEAGSVKERMTRALEVLVSYMASGHELLEIVIPQVARSHPRMTRRVQKIRSAYLRLLEQVIAEGMAAGQIRADVDPAICSRAILGTVVGFHMHATRFNEPLAVEKALPQLIDMLLNGLVSKEASA
ncbi:MAG: TetR/AcrR family transcriptional regulator [Actinobacteria bacterium]|nr:MAG: TetR/AcrR family transcriptional regulator [Actinomycetota bacterium]